MRISTLLFLGGLACACAPGADPAAGPAPAPASTPAPWSATPLERARVPDVFPTVWARAENRDRCALVAPAALPVAEGATPRAATFSGGWGVAYDLPGTRSAFGIAGTGVEAAAPSYSDWPTTRRWSDGSTAGYGPEGGTGPNQLAYLRIEGQGCLYNVWSRLGTSHLEALLEQLRFVSPSSPRSDRP